MGVWEGMSPGGGAGCLGTLSTGTFPLSSGQAPSLLPRDVVAKRPVSASWELQAQVGSGKQVGASGCSSQGGDGEKADACCPALTACRGPLVRSLLVRPVGVVAGDGCFCSLLLSRPQGGRQGSAGKRACREAQSGLQWWDSAYMHTDLTGRVCAPLCVMICQSLGAAAGFCTGQYTEPVLISLCHHVACCFCKYRTQNVVL